MNEVIALWLGYLAGSIHVVLIFKLLDRRYK
jgi:hypothetical protein